MNIPKSEFLNRVENSAEHKELISQLVNKYGQDNVLDLINALEKTNLFKAFDNLSDPIEIISKALETFEGVSVEITTKIKSANYNQQADLESLAAMSAEFDSELLDESVSRTIGGMPENQWRFAVPWAILITTERKALLNKNNSAETNGGGTLEMLVMRIGDEYIVDISRCTKDWKISKNQNLQQLNAEDYAVIKKIFRKQSEAEKYCQENNIPNPYERSRDSRKIN